MISRLYPPRTGGPASITSLLSKELVRRGVKVYVVTQHVSRTKFYEAKDGVEIYRAPSLRIPGISEYNTFSLLCGAISLALVALYVLKKHGIDIVHIQDVSMAAMAGLLLTFLFKRVFVFKYGGDLVFEYVTLKKSKESWGFSFGVEKAWEISDLSVKILYQIQKQYTKCFDYLLPDSCYGAKLLQKMGAHENKIKVVLNGIDVETFSPVADNTLIKKKLNLQGPIILTAARLIPLKGIDYLIKTVPFVLERFPKATLLIVGDGPERTKLMKLAQSLGLNDSVFIIGDVAHDEMKYFLASADIFVLPSFFETIPNALLEAMSMGKPVIASNVGGLAEVIKDRETGILVPPGDTAAIKEAIMEILSNKDLAEFLGANARSFVTKNHAWKDFVSRIVDLYSHCVEKAREDLYCHSTSKKLSGFG